MPIFFVIDESLAVSVVVPLPPPDLLATTGSAKRRPQDQLQAVPDPGLQQADQLRPEAPLHQAVDDEVHRGVEDEQEVVGRDQAVVVDRDMEPPLGITVAMVLGCRVTRMRHIVNLKVHLQYFSKSFLESV